MRILSLLLCMKESVTLHHQPHITITITIFLSHLSLISLCLSHHRMQGTATLLFFPVDNTQGRKDDMVTAFMNAAEKEMVLAPYTRREIPLAWLKTLDNLQDPTNAVTGGAAKISLHQAVQIAVASGVVAGDVPLLLTFLHEMGQLMWHAAPGLSDVVILDPIRYFVHPVTRIICKIRSSADDETYHLLEEHELCAKNHLAEWLDLRDKGVLHVCLLKVGG
jgi:hypothetical protein